MLGGYGLIGGHVVARLLREGFEVIGVGREVAQAARRFPGAGWVQADLRHPPAGGWPQLLNGTEAVVNCAGALQDSFRDDLRAVHLGAVETLAAACAAAGVRRFVQISAVGVETGPGRFAETKRDAEAALARTSLEWVILRPGLVLAPDAYGGSALLRGLAGFPGCIPAVRPDAVVQVVAVEEVAEAVAAALRPDAPTRCACDLVAPQATRLADVLRSLRAWLGLPPAPLIRAPAGIARIVGWKADALGLLGWRSPMRTTALDQLAHGVRGDSAQASRLLGREAMDLAAILAQRPAGVQERWFARSYFVKPLALATLAAFWGVSGAVGLAQRDPAADILTRGGLAASTVQLLATGGAVADLALAGLACVRRTAPLALKGMIAMTAVYLAGATIFTPALWADPLGPLVKSLPAAMLALATLAMMDER